MSGAAGSRFVKAFPSWVVALHRTTGKQSLRPNEYVFKVPKEMTKFDIRQYLEKLYGVQVKTVSTVRYDGKVKMNPYTGKRYRRKEFKKAYVWLDGDEAATPLEWRM